MIISQLELGPPVDHVGGGALNWKAEQADQNYTAVRSLFNIQSDVKSSQRYIISTAALFYLRTDSTWRGQPEFILTNVKRSRVIENSCLLVIQETLVRMLQATFR